MCGNCDDCGHCSFANVTSYFSGFNGKKSDLQLGSNLAYDGTDTCIGRTKVTILTYNCITTSTYSATTKIFDRIFFKINTTLMPKMIFYKNVKSENFIF